MGAGGKVVGIYVVISSASLDVRDERHTHADLIGSVAAYDLTGWTADIRLDTRQRWVAVLPRTARLRMAAAPPHSPSHEIATMLGALTFLGGQSKGAGLRPYLSLGMRYQVDGRAPHPLAALGGSYGLEAVGVPRAPILATAAVGADLALSSRLTLWDPERRGGDADNRASARTSLRLMF
jgi:hypothetical protein